VSSVHLPYPRFLCRPAVAERCAEAPALSSPRTCGTNVPPRHPAGVERLVATPVPSRRLRAVTAGRVLALVLLGLGSTSCADSIAHEAETDRSLRFQGSASAPAALGRTVLDALVRGDRDTLLGLRLTEREHNDVVWPELPASAPELNFPLAYAWQNIERRNRRSLERILPLYSGRDLAYLRVECRGETERFETFEVLTDCWVVFAQGSDPGLLEAQIFKDVLVRGGGYKIFRYYDEGPRGYTGSEGG